MPSWAASSPPNQSRAAPAGGTGSTAAAGAAPCQSVAARAVTETSADRRRVGRTDMGDLPTGEERTSPGVGAAGGWCRTRAPDPQTSTFNGADALSDGHSDLP